MKINGDNYSNFGEMVVKYGIPSKPTNSSMDEDKCYEYKPFIRVDYEYFEKDQDEVVIKYGIPTPPKNDNYKPQKNKDEDVVIKYGIPTPHTPTSEENKSLLKKFLDKLFKK